jgi:prepilin-type N-terminal cleavage/methylation domain-containing protein
MNRTIRQRGDTIIEVLLAMAVIGLVMGAAFGIANRSVNIGRSAQERTEALKIAESQLEKLKAKTPAVITPAPVNFCIDNAGALVDASNPSCISQNGQGGAGLYTINISKPDIAVSGSPYTITISWDRLGASQASVADRRDTVNLYYKLGAL